MYAKRFHTPEYFYFSPETLEFTGFRLDINQYKPITPNAQGWMWSEILGLFLGIHERQLRYFSLEGALLPTPQEAAQNEMQKAEQERLNAEQERLNAEQQLNRAERAEAKLQELQEKMRSLGIDYE